MKKLLRKKQREEKQTNVQKKMKHIRFNTTEHPNKEGAFNEAFATLSGMNIQVNCLSVRMVLRKSRGWYYVRVDVYDDSESENNA